MDPVVHFEIPTEDLERAKRFYGEIFGWKLTQLGPEMGHYVLAHTGPTDDAGRLNALQKLGSVYAEKLKDPVAAARLCEDAGADGTIGCG